MKSRPLSASTASTFGSTFFPKTKDFHMNPKIIIYRTNGTGRDTYIDYDNGGFRKLCPTNYKKIYSTIRGESWKAPNINPKFPIYKSDGYGRDSYIYSSCGGFFRCSSVKAFPKTLREYNSSCTIRKKNDYIYYANNYRTPQQIKEANKKARLQRSLSARLSRPKYLH